VRWMSFPHPIGTFVLAFVILIGSGGELAARGGGGMGRMGGGGISRGGMARNGSLGGYQRPAPSARTTGRRASQDRTSTSERSTSQGSRSGESRSNDGSFETRRGETVDWESEVTRGENGLQRETSWESTSGASGQGSSKVRIEDGRVQSVDRSRHVESATGETLDRQVSSSRDGDWIVREGSVRTSTGVDADTASAIRKTDDGYVARGAVSGKNGAAAGTIVRNGDDVYARGGRIEGDDVTWGRVHCNDGNCQGGRVTADIDDYYLEPYYYYPYYYGWYSCPPGGVQTWSGAYGTPVYGCSHVTVIETTIALGPAPSDSSSYLTEGSGSRDENGRLSASEARVTSAPVLMYEIDPSVVVYSTDYEPEGVYSVKRGERHFWVPGAKKGARDIDNWTKLASSMPAPTANASMITYGIGSQVVYFTSERPAPGFYSAPSNNMFVWIPGVREPRDGDLAVIDRAIEAHRAGGQNALDREARKLELNRDPPPGKTASITK
jgi:hypothetical protein